MEDNNIISFTKVRLPYGWLGNMSPFPINFAGKEWCTTEALFQAMRFNDPEIQEEIRSQKSPMAAKLVAKGKVEKMVVKQLSEQDLDNMMTCIKLKVEQHPELKQQLLETGNARIIEDVTNRGRKGSNLFWGALLNENGEWEGTNALGELWMILREELRNGQNESQNQHTEEVTSSDKASEEADG